MIRATATTERAIASLATKGQLAIFVLAPTIATITDIASMAPADALLDTVVLIAPFAHAPTSAPDAEHAISLSASVMRDTLGSIAPFVPALMIALAMGIATMAHASAILVGTELGVQLVLAPTIVQTLDTATMGLATAMQGTRVLIALFAPALVSALTTASA